MSHHHTSQRHVAAQASRAREEEKVHSKLTQWTRRTPSATALPRRRKLVEEEEEEEEEEGLFKAGGGVYLCSDDTAEKKTMSHHVCHIIIHTCRHIIILVVYLCSDDTAERGRESGDWRETKKTMSHHLCHIIIHTCHIIMLGRESGDWRETEKRRERERQKRAEEEEEEEGLFKAEVTHLHDTLHIHITHTLSPRFFCKIAGTPYTPSSNGAQEGNTLHSS